MACARWPLIRWARAAPRSANHSSSAIGPRGSSVVVPARPYAAIARAAARTSVMSGGSSGAAPARELTLRQADGAVGDDVLLHLGRARADRGVALPRVVVGVVPVRDGVGPTASEETRGTEQVDPELGEVLRQVAPLELGQWHLGPVLLAFQHLRQRAVVEQTRQLDLGVRASDALAEVGVVERLRVVLTRRRDHVVELDPHGDGEPRGADALVTERAHGHLPALPLLAQPVLDGHPGAGEEDLVEQRVTRDLADGTALDARHLHVDDQGGDPLVLGAALDRGGVGAHEEQAPLGDVGRADPDLLTVEHVLVAVADRGRPQVGEVAAGLGLAEALAPV